MSAESEAKYPQMKQCQAQTIDQHKNVQGVIYDVGHQSAALL
jgi:hypothetical protein